MVQGRRKGWGPRVFRKTEICVVEFRFLVGLNWSIRDFMRKQAVLVWYGNCNSK